jgi:RNA recognition motif-containing protein
VGYAFVDLETAEEAEKAIAELSGKEILERKVSVQLARKPEPAGEKTEAAVSGGEGASGGEGRKRGSGRGRGRGRGRGGRFRGATRGVSRVYPFLVVPLLTLLPGSRRDW